MGLWGRVVVGSCAGVLVLAGCSAEGPPPSDEPLPKVVYPKAAVPKDRDERAVLAALRQVDACAFVDPAPEVVPGFAPDRKPRASGPFTCAIEGDAGTVQVKIAKFDDEDRYRLPLRLVGGAKAYVRTTIGGTTCTVSLPVSFSLAIQVSTFTEPPADPCAGPLGFAQVAVTSLANPDVTAVTASWDACTVLTLAAGGGKFAPGLFGIEDCVATGEGPSLHFGYGWSPERNTTFDMVGGKRAAITDGTALGPACSVSWRHGSARSTYPAGSPELWASVNVVDCARAKALAEQVMTVIAAPPPADVAPQRPVLYGSGEADVPAPGACAYWTKPENCQPYVDVPVPAGAREIVRGADADLNVDCALAREAVAKNFGEQLKPVTVADLGCEFIEPTRLFRISVSTNPTPLRKPDDDERETTIAGHPGRVMRLESYCRIAVSAERNADGYGTLFFSLNGQLVDATMTNAESAVADIVEKYFNQPRR